MEKNTLNKFFVNVLTPQKCLLTSKFAALSHDGRSTESRFSSICPTADNVEKDWWLMSHLAATISQCLTPSETREEVG